MMDDTSLEVFKKAWEAFNKGGADWRPIIISGGDLDCFLSMLKRFGIEPNFRWLDRDHQCLRVVIVGRKIANTSGAGCLYSAYIFDAHTQDFVSVEVGE